MTQRLSRVVGNFSGGLALSRIFFLVALPVAVALFSWPIFLFATIDDKQEVSSKSDLEKDEMERIASNVSRQEISESLLSGFSLSTEENPLADELSEYYPLGWKGEEKFKSWYDIRVKPGDTLQNILLVQGFTLENSREIVRLLNPIYRVTRLKAHQTLEFIQDENQMPTAVNILLAPNSAIHIKEGENGDFSINQFEKNLHTNAKVAEGTIKNSLYADALKAGGSENAIFEAIYLLGYAIDFQRDVTVGDKFKIAFLEETTEDGVIVDDSEIEYIEYYLSSRDKLFEFFRYERMDGTANYYDAEGKSARRAFLKSPVHGAYISSGYGSRISPISGYRMNHQAIDFAVRSGTPIFATSAGTVTYAGYSRVYGYYVKIRHDNGYETMYAHMSRFSSSGRKGKRVMQSETIGYVGSTGQSTGPHVHYVMKRSGRAINPMSLRFPSSERLRGTDVELFNLNTKAIQSSIL